MARLARLFVPLDVEFATDPKIIAAGPLASYLYVCGLAYAKRSGQDGFIHTAQVQFLAPGCSRTTALTQRLVETGLWTATDGGWMITAWARHNLSGDQLAERKEMQRAKAIAGNHQRHHVAKKVVEPDCELCQASPHGDRSSSPQGDGMVPRNREGRGIEKGEEEEEAAAAADDPTTHIGTSLNDYPAAAAALELFIDHRQSQVQPENTTGFRRSVRVDEMRLRGPLAIEYMTDHPDADSHDVLEHVFGLSEMSIWRLTGQTRKGA